MNYLENSLVDRRTTCNSTRRRAQSHSPMLSNGLTVLAVSLLLAFGLLSQPVHAQEAPAQISIAAQPLASALVQLANKYSLELAYSPDVVAGMSAPAISGRLTVDQALRRLLAGTGIEFKRNGRNVSLSAPQAPVAQLSAITVTGAVISPEDTFNPPTTIGSRVPLEQREIPQSVTVISQEQIQDQNMKNLDDAMRMAPGVFLQKQDATRTSYYDRGFAVDNYQIDGVPIETSLAQAVPGLSAYDRVEYLSGPAGLLNGIGGPGGAINLVRKRPTKDYQFSGGLSGGSYGNYQQDIDVSGPLNATGSLRARIAGSLLNQDTPRKGAHRTDGSLYGVLEYDLTPDTLLRAGFAYDRLSVKDQYDGYPSYSNETLLKDAQRLYLGADWNRQIYTSKNIFADIEHKFGNGWSTKLSANYTDYSFDNKMASPSAAIDVDTNTVLMRMIRGTGSDKQGSLDIFANGPYSLFGRTHQLTIGATYLHDRLYQHNPYISLTNLFGYTTVSIFDPDVPEPEFNGPVYNRTTTTDQESLYANTRISIADPLTLVLGARATWWKSDFTPDPNANFIHAASTSDSIAGHITPYAGLIYDIDQHNSVYASYTGIFEPQSVRDASGQLLKPIQGNQYEVGIKGAYLNGRLNTSFALFQLTQENRPLLDPSDPTGETYLASGRARVSGLEAQVSGKILPNWDVAASYTYMTTKYLDASSNIDSPFEAIAPRHMLKIWTNYKLTGALHKWSVGGNAYITSKFSSLDPQGESSIVQGGYAVVGARIGYQVDKNISAALDVSNIFNRYYYSRLGLDSGGNWIGDPRTVMLSLRVKY